jgi:hypothetical protein
MLNFIIFMVYSIVDSALQTQCSPEGSWSTKMADVSHNISCGVEPYEFQLNTIIALNEDYTVSQDISRVK